MYLPLPCVQIQHEKVGVAIAYEIVSLDGAVKLQLFNEVKVMPTGHVGGAELAYVVFAEELGFELIDHLQLYHANFLVLTIVNVVCEVHAITRKLYQAGLCAIKNVLVLLLDVVEFIVVLQLHPDLPQNQIAIILAV